MVHVLLTKYRTIVDLERQIDCHQTKFYQVAYDQHIKQRKYLTFFLNIRGRVFIFYMCIPCLNIVILILTFIPKKPYFRLCCRFGNSNDDLKRYHMLYWLLSPSNSVGGYIVTRPFVGGWVSEWVGGCVRACVRGLSAWSRPTLDTIATTVFAQSLSNFTCKLWIMKKGTLLILGHGVKGQGQLWHSVYKTLWTRYRLQFLPNHFQTSHVSCGRWEEEPYWFGFTGSKVKVNVGTLCITPYEYNTDYSLCPTTFNFTCRLWMMRAETLLILRHGVIGQG